MTEDDVEQVARAIRPYLCNVENGEDFEAALDAIAALNAREPGGEVAARVTDWLGVAKSAGEHGIRYRTNAALERFLAEIAPLYRHPPATFAPDSEPDTIGSHHGNGGQFDPLAMRKGVIATAKRLAARMGAEFVPHEPESGGDGATQADREAGARLYGWAWGDMDRANDLTRTMILEAVEHFRRHRLAHSAGRGEK